MSTIFTHLLLYVWVFTQGVFLCLFDLLPVSLYPFLNPLYCVFLPPTRVSFGVVIVPTSKERIRNLAAEASEPKRKTLSSHLRLSKDTWLCQRAVRVNPLFHCVDSTRMQICWGRLPRLFCTTWAVLLSTVCVCKWVCGLSVLNAGMHHWILKNTLSCGWLLQLMHVVKKIVEVEITSMLFYVVLKNLSPMVVVCCCVL